MLDHIEQSLFIIASNAVLFLYEFTQRYNLLFSALAGLFLPSLFFGKPEKKEIDIPLQYRLLVVACIASLMLGTFSTIIIPFLAEKMLEIATGKLYSFPFYFELDLSKYFEAGIHVKFLIQFYQLFIITTVFFILHVFLRRWLTPKVDSLKHQSIKKTTLARNERTDVRNIRDFLPMTEKYNPEDYIDLEKGIFIGLDEQKIRNTFP